jgi:sulfur-oxidizing protein SoxY
LTRRQVLRAAAAAGIAAAWPPRPARAQGFLANLAPEEPVEKTIQRLFGGRPIRDGAAAITLELPLIAEDGGNVAMSVEVKSPMTSQSYVKAIYILSDKNPRPLNARFNLTPACGQAYIATSLRLADTGDVRAVAEMQDGSLLMVKRSVRVVVAGCAA